MTVVADEAWLALLTRSQTEKVTVGSIVLPGFPPEDIQRATVGNVGAGPLREAWQFARDVTVRFRKSPRFTDRSKTLLDFGACWGRISRCFLRDFDPRNITGIDVSKYYLDFYKQLFPGPRLVTCAALPPVDLPSASFDFIVGFSVFSHLSEVACRAWSAEFGRLLKPDGMAALTTRSRSFFDYHRDHIAANGRDAPATPDYEAAKARYDAGQVVHSHTEWGRATANHYGETWIPPDYAAKHFIPLTLTDAYDSGPITVFIFARE